MMAHRLSRRGRRSVESEEGSISGRAAAHSLSRATALSGEEVSRKYKRNTYTHHFVTIYHIGII